MSTGDFSKQVAALCSRWDVSAEWYPWTYWKLGRRAPLLERLRWKP